MKGAGRGNARRTGAAALALLSASAVTALVLARNYHLGVAATLVAILGGLPGLYLTWAAYRVAQHDADEAAGRGLAEIADGLAGRLGSQWVREAEARRLNDPYPLQVFWTAADGPLAGDLDALKRLAVSGAGWSASARENWARGPEDLAGGDRKLADVLAAVPTGRLVVLGEPGAGKTMLMVRLVLDLLHPDRRSSGGPIPVLASLASWDPVSHDLHGWLGATLVTDYPDLAGAAPPGSARDTRFEALLEAGLILPVLDGLDEVPEPARPIAITRINRELKPGEQVVVTCRTEQYRAAVSPPEGQGVALRAAAVQLRTVEFGEVTSYLRKDAGPAAGGRWDFLDTLGPESPARQALTAPLMAGLARAIYNNPRPDERAGDLRHPAELRDFPDQGTVEAHLFDAFIPAAYRPPTGGRWTAKNAEMWLRFLARHLEQTTGSPDLAWWQLQEAAPRAAFGLVGGLAFGLVAGLVAGMVVGLSAGLVAGLVAGLAGALMVGLVVGLASRFGAKAPARGVRISVRGLAAGLAAGLVVGLGVGLAFGTAAGLVAGLASMLAFGLASVPGDLAGVTSPGAVLARDRQVALLLILAGGLACGLMSGLSGGLAGGLKVGLVAGLVAGTVDGLGVGLGLSMSQTAWPSYMLTRGWLAFHHHLPWSLMSFLSDARQRGVLRQAGAVYQFRHLELQRRLATRP